MKQSNHNSEAGSGSKVAGRNNLSAENLRSRRDFLKKAVKRGAIPAVVVYSALNMKTQAGTLCNYV